MAITSAEELAQHALNLNLLDETQLREIWGEFGSQNVSLDEFRQLLLRRDLLTFYQIEHLIARDRTTFYYGDYKVLYLVGTGTFARVYRATDRLGKKQVAVKVLRKRYSELKEEADRFHREGVMCQGLRHPNIVPIYEVDSQGNNHYLVMEFVEGRNLLEFVRIRKSCEPLEATRLMLDIAGGLDYAFGRGISHRDLKMSNVLVSSLGQAKLVDFGLAGTDLNATDEVIQKSDNPRAIDYAGLERSTGVRKGDARSDIFFAGCIYYHMLTGQAPLVETRERSQRLRKSRFREIPPILQVKPDLPHSIALVVKKALSFDPDRRYQTPGELATDLRGVLARESAAEEAGEGALKGDNSQQRTVMVVEGDVKMQNLFRDSLKKSGYRVLVTSDPQRAAQRFADDSQVADVVLFSSGMLGESAVEAFNDFGQRNDLKNVPALLLLSERQRNWKSSAQSNGHRLVATMPIKLRQLREALAKLTATAQA